MEALVAKPLETAGLNLQILMYILQKCKTLKSTEPAGAGDVPTANYKMIGALAVKKGQLEKAQLPEFFKKAWIRWICANTRTYSIRCSICRICKRANILKEQLRD